MRITIEVPDDQADAFQDEMVQRGFVVEVEDDQDFEVPQWQIDEVRRRIAVPDRPAPRLWSEIDAEYRKKRL